MMSLIKGVASGQPNFGTARLKIGRFALSSKIAPLSPKILATPLIKIKYGTNWRNKERKKKEKGQPALLSRVTVDKWRTSENERGQSLAGRSLIEQKGTACLSIANANIKAVSIVDSTPESSVETS